MVSVGIQVTARPDAAAVAGAVPDPELRVVSVAELGILREVSTVDGPDPGAGVEAVVVVTITPTYAGCPAMDTIRADIQRALHRAGYPRVSVRTVLSPPWSTDWITPVGRDKLRAAGIAPPDPVAGGPVPLGLPGIRAAVPCPRCGSTTTQEISRFGSTACKALWRCRSCGEPFDRVKPL